MFTPLIDKKCYNVNAEKVSVILTEEPVYDFIAASSNPSVRPLRRIKISSFACTGELLLKPKIITFANSYIIPISPYLYLSVFLVSLAVLNKRFPNAKSNGSKFNS